MDVNLEAILNSNDLEKISRTAQLLIQENRKQDTAQCFLKLCELNPNDIAARFNFAVMQDDGTHKSWALGRDIGLQILEECPQIIESKNTEFIAFLRPVAHWCHNVGR